MANSRHKTSELYRIGQQNTRDDDLGITGAVCSYSFFILGYPSASIRTRTL